MPVIIKDVDGQDLVLLRDRLEETQGSLHSDERWGVTFSAMRQSLAKSSQYIFATLPAKYSRDTKRIAQLFFNPTPTDSSSNQPPFSIGCRTFDKKTFALILRAAGVKLIRKRTKVARRKK
jgi:hypothetical protein